MSFFEFFRKSGDTEKEPSVAEQGIPPQIDEMERAYRDIYKNSADVVVMREKSVHGHEFLIAFIDGMASSDLIDRDIVLPLLQTAKSAEEYQMFAAGTTKTNTIAESADTILEGNAFVYIDGSANGISVDFKDFAMRAVTEPTAEAVMRGSREGFIESFRTNAALLRRRIHSTDLAFENFKIGRLTRTNVALAYMESLVDREILDKVRCQINNIEADSILDSGYIEQYIEKHKNSLFATIGNTQKPDVAAAKILEGRICIIVDGSPHVLTIPHLFIENLQTADDYYSRPFIVSALRLLRLAALLISIFLPALYIVFQNYNQEMVPTSLLITMMSLREGIPFPVTVEVIVMMVLFEFLKESGLRLPRQIGSAISIVGALIVGDAAVSAGIVSAPTVIVVAAAALSAYIVPPLNDVVSFYRIILILAAATFGILGITFGIVWLVMQTSSLDSFGVSYMLPLTPQNKEGMRDFLIRFPLRRGRHIPFSSQNNNKRDF